jgi:hypothetical protein
MNPGWKSYFLIRRSILDYDQSEELLLLAGFLGGAFLGSGFRSSFLFISHRTSPPIRLVCSLK